MAFGNPDRYVEPFFGSGAVYLSRPNPGGLEVINDLNGYIANFWRAVKQDPQVLAVLANYPNLELDLHARHQWLWEQSTSLQEQLMADPGYYDILIAAWWVWGASIWLGEGWCTGSVDMRKN